MWTSRPSQLTFFLKNSLGCLQMPCWNYHGSVWSLTRSTALHLFGKYFEYIFFSLWQGTIFCYYLNMCRSSSIYFFTMKYCKLLWNCKNWTRSKPITELLGAKALRKHLCKKVVSSFLIYCTIQLLIIFCFAAPL